MKISVIAPPYIPIPPPMYGGIEMVAYELVEGLTKLGEDVILFAPRGSEVSCRLVPFIEEDIYFGLDSTLREKRLVSILASKFAYAMSVAGDVDIIHDHKLSLNEVDIPKVYTLHGPANEHSVNRCVELTEQGNNYFVAISDRQKELYLQINKNINFVGTVHNSIDVENIPFSSEKEDFFLFIGRSNWEKGLDLAVRVANKARVGLVMAVKKSEQFEKEFFEKEIQPWIDSFPKDLHFKLYEEINKDLKADLYKRARCTLFTSQWEEPFGMVMIESMAAGTPVISLRRGAAPEVIVDGKTGFLVDTEQELVEATKKTDRISPRECRRHVRENFSNTHMAQKYLDIYRDIIGKS
ncbi:MAG: glycosyltransferase family 4 protein [Elusimicrobiota bacterium]|nr:glycosyltransferase family 4 protein [Elusimicrobiota bacterium]